MEGGIPDYLYSLGHTLNDYVPSLSSLPSLPPVPAVYCEGCKHFLGFWSITNNKALCDTCEEYYLKLNLVKDACGEEGDNFDYDPLTQLNNYLAHPTELRKNIVKEGPLKKLFKGISSDSKWSSVWCVLLQDRLVYFCNRDDALDCLPLGSVNNIKGTNVQQYEDHRNNLHCFIIRREQLEYHFAALTEREAQDWFRAISNPQQLPSSSSPASEREQSMLDSFVVIGRPTRFEATPFDWESVSQTTHTILDVSEQKLRANNINISDLAVLTQNDLDDPDEYFACRQELGELASLWVSEHDPVLLLAAGTTDSQLPSNFPSEFEVELTMGRTTSVFKIDKYGLATETSELVQWMTQACSLTTDSVFWNAPEFVLKPTPYREHIFESVPLPSLLYVRESIAKGRVPIKFEIVGLSLQSLKAFIEGDHLKTAFPTLKTYREYLAKRDQEERNRYTNAFTNALNSSMSLTASVFASKPYKTKNIRCFASNEVSRLLELKINSVMNPKTEADRSLVAMVENVISSAYKYSIHVGIYFGGLPLAPTQYTEWKDKPEWKEWIRFRLPISNIPHEARVCFTFCACKLTTINSEISEKLVQKKAWVNLNLFQSNGLMKQGRMPLKLWTNGEEANPLGVCGQNIQLDATLDIEFASTPLPIVHRPLNVPPTTLPTTTTTTAMTTTATVPPSADSRKPTGEALEFLKRLLRMDSLHRFKAEDRRLIWHYRYWCRTNFPTRLGRVLSSVNWINPLQVQEAHRLLGEWRSLPPIYAMELLDGRFSDRKVREFAVECLRGLKDNELVPWLAQLVQVLKYEPYHCCALSEFLIFRAVRSFLIGHTLFWHLQAELHNPTVAIRFELLMEAFKKSLQAPLHRTILDGFDTQRSLIRKLRRIADAMKGTPIINRRAKLREALESEVRIPATGILLPFDPRVEVFKLCVENCKVMGSATSPLWLVFKDKLDNDVIIIFKTGDDLRTDVLMLQMIGMMDKMWKEQGMDLHMQPYSCVCTGCDEGMIQVVSGAETASEIQMNFALKNGYTAATISLRNEVNPLQIFLEEHNKGNMDEVVNNFVVSCAGYCVATYILGIGDRHNDNILVSYNGDFFHIDFGFVLGNMTTFAGVSRETAPFVFTLGMMNVMGGTESLNFKRFVSLSCDSYNTIRKNADHFLILLTMMMATGISQLRSFDDLKYVQQALHLEMTDEEASQFFTECIFASVTNARTQLNWAIHNLAKK